MHLGPLSKKSPRSIMAWNSRLADEPVLAAVPALPRGAGGGETDTISRASTSSSALDQAGLAAPLGAGRQAQVAAG